MDNYSIYIVNKTENKETFWCFLSKPETLEVGSTIYANSSARMTLKGNAGDTAFFRIPVQYKLAATSQNRPTGLGVKVYTSQNRNVDLQQQWRATFYTDSEHQAPDLDKTGDGAKPNEITYSNNAFNPNDAKLNEWFPSKTFGLETVSGFIGMTWEALPNKTETISPNIEFYISTGSYHPNELADYTQVQTDAAKLTKDSFSGFAATVTLLENGTWQVTPGKPSLHTEAHAY